MIIIRGIKGEQYAKKIKKGIVGCRDESVNNSV